MPAPSSGGSVPDISQRRFAAEYATARVLAESARLAEATPRILEAICTTLGWEHGALWRVDPGAGEKASPHTGPTCPRRILNSRFWVL